MINLRNGPGQNESGTDQEDSETDELLTQAEETAFKWLFKCACLGIGAVKVLTKLLAEVSSLGITVLTEALATAVVYGTGIPLGGVVALVIGLVALRVGVGLVIR
jgi:hypothetical protein